MEVFVFYLDKSLEMILECMGALIEQLNPLDSNFIPIVQKSVDLIFKFKTKPNLKFFILNITKSISGVHPDIIWYFKK